MRKYILLAIFFTIFLSNTVLADIEKGKWNFTKDPDYCYIGSAPTASDIPEGKKRGNVYILVYRINGNPDAVIQINAGYPYKNEEPVNVKIDKKDYEFYSIDDSAWTNNDKEIIYAMKKGLKLVVTGLSSKGTKTIDTYSLKGFTSAFNKLSEDC